MSDFVYNIPDNIPDNSDDQPVPGRPLTSVGSMAVPEIVFGAATLSADVYNTGDWLESDQPLRTLRLALRYGIRFIDTSPHYGQSESVLGALLQRLSTEFPRSSYKLMSKCGREGKEFDYSPENVRASVMRSLKRIGTSYLDFVLLHDIEFVASPVWPIPYCGDFERALVDPRTRGEWGLDWEKPARPWGKGDDTILAAINELQKMKEEGLVRAVGISGYPLPTLLRIGRLIAQTPYLRPLDCILSYSHTTLQNNRLEMYLGPLLTHGQVRQIFTASPLSMGLLGPNRPSWHPAPLDMVEASRVAQTSISATFPEGLPNLALGFCLRRPKSHAETSPYNDVPTVVGLSTVNEVHEVMSIWREVSIPGTNTMRKSKEDVARSIFQAAGWVNWSWSSPPNADFDRLAVDQLGRRLRAPPKQ
ncbi:hypothetical protein FRC18_009479 [Serendipita sp. 400]|nr:hypothetical protein FRC18_009479 [Serendipita sp. 400]